MVDITPPARRPARVTPPVPRPVRGVTPPVPRLTNYQRRVSSLSPLATRRTPGQQGLTPGLPETLKGLAVGVPSGLLGLPADLAALVLRDVPQLAEKLFTGQPLTVEDQSQLDVLLSRFQERAGSEAVREGIVGLLDIDTGGTPEEQEAFEQASIASEIVTPIPTAAGLAKLFQRVLGSRSTDVAPRPTIQSEFDASALPSTQVTDPAPFSPDGPPPPALSDAPPPIVQPQVDELVDAATADRTDLGVSVEESLVLDRDPQGKILPFSPTGASPQKLGLIPTEGFPEKQGDVVDYSPVRALIQAIPEDRPISKDELLRVLDPENPAYTDQFRNSFRRDLVGVRFDDWVKKFGRDNMTRDEVLAAYDSVAPEMRAVTVLEPDVETSPVFKKLDSSQKTQLPSSDQQSSVSEQYIIPGEENTLNRGHIYISNAKADVKSPDGSETLETKRHEALHGMGQSSFEYDNTAQRALTKGEKSGVPDLIAHQRFAIINQGLTREQVAANKVASQEVFTDANGITQVPMSMLQESQSSQMNRLRRTVRANNPRYNVDPDTGEILYDSQREGGVPDPDNPDRGQVLEVYDEEKGARVFGPGFGGQQGQLLTSDGSPTGTTEAIELTPTNREEISQALSGRKQINETIMNENNTDVLSGGVAENLKAKINAIGTPTRQNIIDSNGELGALLAEEHTAAIATDGSWASMLSVDVNARGADRFSPDNQVLVSSPKGFREFDRYGPGFMDTKDYVNKILDKIEADPDKTRVFNEGVLSKIEQNPTQAPNIEIKEFIERNPEATPLEFFKNNDASYIDYNEFTTNADNFPDVQNLKLYMLSKFVDTYADNPILAEAVKKLDPAKQAAKAQIPFKDTRAFEEYLPKVFIQKMYALYKEGKQIGRESEGRVRGVIIPHWEDMRDVGGRPRLNLTQRQMNLPPAERNKIVDATTKNIYEAGVKKALNQLGLADEVVILDDTVQAVNYNTGNIEPLKLMDGGASGDKVHRGSDRSGKTRAIYFDNPKVQEILDRGVIKRAKGGEVDLRPRKLVHSGIGAMAKQVM
jgi:hypothetical protein